MIRSTQNATISTLMKSRTFPGGLFPDVFPRGDSYELVYDSITRENKEFRDSVNIHTETTSLFPSNAFNGTFE